MNHDLPLRLHDLLVPPDRCAGSALCRALVAKGGRMGEPLTDGVLVQRAGRGDSIAFSELVHRHYRRAMRVAFGLMRDVQDAEEVVQEAFARVHARLPEFEGAAGFYTWLYRIVVHLSIDVMRQRRRAGPAPGGAPRGGEASAAAPDRAASDAGPWPLGSVGSPAGGPEVEAQRHALAGRLQEAFAQLPELHQAVLLLRELEGFSYDEIAVTLQIKKGSVMSRLFHGRRAMQLRLQGEVPDKKAAPEGGT